MMMDELLYFEQVFDWFFLIAKVSRELRKKVQ